MCIYFIVYSAGEYTGLSTYAPKGLHLPIDSGGPRLQVLGDNHVI
jgi:hypothetical protein